MQLPNMQLAARAAIFSEIIAQTQCTDKLGKIWDLESAMQEAMRSLECVCAQGNRLYLIGNGGSAAVASHAQVDFVNVAKINAQVVHEPALLTCMANDYGYEHAYARVLSQWIHSQDVLIAISSSGKSKNIIHAVEQAKQRQAQVITFTGFDAQNPLRALGDLNFWLNSSDYGFVEVGHQFILHNLSDRFGVKKLLTDEVKRAEAFEVIA